MHQKRLSSRVAAGPNDPRVSVSLISEHTFSARAAVIAYEQDQEDTGQEPAIASARHVTVFYTIGQIYRELQRIKNILKTIGVSIGIVLAITCLAFLIGGLWPIASFVGYIGIAVGVISVIGLLIVGAQYVNIYYGHYLPAKNTPPSEPQPPYEQPKDVDWWGLINAGFQVVTPQDPYLDQRLQVIGRPWRILVRGPIRIPVFRARQRRNGEDRLFRKHFVRMAAYCHLLAPQDRAQSPYGVVLFGNTLKGKSVPNVPGSQRAFHDELINTRQTLINLRQKIDPPPAPSNRCRGCQYSRRDRMTGQSECGTRFNWTPPNFRDEKTSDKEGIDD